MQAEFGDARGENRVGSVFGNDLGVSVEGEAQTTDVCIHCSRLFDWKKRVERGLKNRLDESDSTGLWAGGIELSLRANMDKVNKEYKEWSNPRGRGPSATPSGCKQAPPLQRLEEVRERSAGFYS